MDPIIARPIAWNEARYSQEFNHELASDLLYEEYEEYSYAETDVDKLDALCDIYFVAVGVLWKLEVPNIEQFLQDVNYKVSTVLAVDLEEYIARFMSTTSDVLKPVYIAHILALASALMKKEFKFKEEHIHKAILIVCDANDTKEIKKTPSYIKANTVKGTNFVAPEPRLQLLLQEVRDASK